MRADVPVKIDAQSPCWREYLPLIRELDFSSFPGPDQLNRLLPEHAVTGSGHPVRFVDAALQDAGDYEQRIHRSGRVSTRSGNWHDLFNALVWARYPLTKAALNALHHAGKGDSGRGRRGALRDALTLFDECGVVLLSSDDALLDALARRDWQEAFCARRQSWAGRASLTVVGHAMLEKFLSPYKSMTANALLVRVGDRHLEPTGGQLAGSLDHALAAGLREPGLLRSPADLAPLPLAGIPGWWRADAQDAAFYADRSVFRPPREKRAPAPVFRLF